MADSILLIGDSMAEAIAKPLERLFNSTGNEYVYRFKRGTQVSYWIENLELPQIVETSSPDYVVISLGTNDIVAKKSNETIIDNLDKLMENIQTLSDKKISFILIAPPIQMDNELNIAMKEHYGESCFTSKDLNLTTAADKIHPIYEADVSWAKEVYDYLLLIYPNLITATN
jgi:lysophospholipase L1-like esterase